MTQNVVLSAEIIQHGPKSGSLSKEIHHVPRKVLLSTEMFDMLNHVGSSV